jgi:hypothetical protein
MGQSLIVRYSSDSYHKWMFDSEREAFVRYYDAAFDSGDGESFDLLMDRNNQSPIIADNIVILFVPYRFFSRNPEMMETNLVGKGKAIVFRDGKAFEVTWDRSKIEDIIAIKYEDGSPFPLKPGKTWFDILGETSQVNQAPEWRFQFTTP